MCAAAQPFESGFNADIALLGFIVFLLVSLVSVAAQRLLAASKIGDAISQRRGHSSIHSGLAPLLASGGFRNRQ